MTKIIFPFAIVSFMIYYTIGCEILLKERYRDYG